MKRIVVFCLQPDLAGDCFDIDPFAIEHAQADCRFRMNLDKGLWYFIAKARNVAVLLIHELQQAERRQYERIC